MTDNIGINFSLEHKLNDLVTIIGIFSPKAAAKITNRRIQAIYAILKSAQEKLNSLNLSNEEYRNICLKCQIPIIENASLEEDPTLQDLWANLIANSFNPHYDNEIRTSFIDILKKLTVFDAKLLKAYYYSNHPITYLDSVYANIWVDDHYKKVERRKIDESFVVLKSLSLFDNTTLSDDRILSNSSVVTFTNYYLTALGELFIDACIKDATQRS